MASEVRINDHTSEFLSELEARIGIALEEIGITAEGYAKMKCPVNTGNLRNSITHVVDDKAAYIGTNVEYAPYVEMGTSRTVAQPFLKPAAVDHSSEYERILKSELSG